MAERQAVLTMTPTEEAALSRLIGFLCKSENGGATTQYLTRFLGRESSDIEQIGRINVALNANR